MNHDADFIASYKAIRRDVERFAVFLCRDRSLAHDLVQDALVTAFQQWSGIGSAERLKPYVIAAVVRMYRRRARRAAQTADMPDLESIVADASTPSDVLADVAMVRDAIGRLPDTLRIPLVLAEIEGYALQDIAQMLGIGLSAVKMRVKRGRDELRRLFEEQEVLKEAGQ